MSSSPNLRPLRPLRPLLAAAPAGPPVSTGTEAGLSRPSGPLEPKKRRALAAAACEACRKRKAKCTADRPRCAACVARQIECKYDTTDASETRAKAVKRKYEEISTHVVAYDRVFDALRSRPEHDAAAILQRIRRGDDIQDILRQIESGDLLLQVSLAPETKYRYTFPISPNMPASLLLPSNPYLDSLIYEWASPPTAEANASRPPTSARQVTAASAEFYSPYLHPYHAAEIIDVRLSVAEPSKWTTVCANDTLMRRLLSRFFLQDHDWWTAFQKDYFLEDMANMRHQLCSPLLVNAVLALSCIYYRDLPGRAEFWNPNTLGYRFLAEAKRLWEYEQDKNKLTTIHAALAFNIIYNAYGADKIGWAYATQAITMACQMGLFGSSTPVNSERLRKARDYTAWALFSWQSLFCFHYFRPPLIDHPPDVALPEPSADPRWYGELWLQYPRRRTLHPSHSGEVFKAKAEFAVIMNDAAQRLFSVEPPLQDISAEEIAHFYRRFRDWYNALPECLSPRRIVLPSQLKVHMHYFQVLLRLLQTPTLSEEKSPGSDTSTADLFEQPIQQLISYLKASLEILLRVYYLRHGFEWLDTFLVALLAVRCFQAMDEIHAYGDSGNIPDLRSTVVLLAKGIYEQGQSFFLGQMMFQLVGKKMRPEELATFEHLVKVEPMKETQSSAFKQVQMEWPVEIVSIADDPESKRLGDVLKRFRDVSLESSSGDATP